MAAKINAAIDKGAAYVKAYTFNEKLQRPGTWALRGWALVESGIPASDPAVKRLADYVRHEVTEMDGVYDLSLSIIFLDKLGDVGDAPLIESMAVRLMAAQGVKGGWHYDAAKPNAAERNRLENLTLQAETARKNNLPLKLRPRTPKEIEHDIALQLKAITVNSLDFLGDNSNTQFAMIALWVARRHGVPVAANLALAERRFQVSQIKSGAWGYQFPDKDPPEDDNHYAYPAMTCAGLLGLALGQGVKAKPNDLMKDVQVQRGLKVVARALTEPPPAKKSNLNYFLFSMERIAVILNLKKIGDHDWYLWGAQKLVDSQAADGSWNAGFEFQSADTCLALLFLKRANVAMDLTEILRAPIRRDADPIIRKGPGAKKQ